MSGTQDAARAPSLGDVVSAATFAVAIITAWLYAAGWSYAYHYLDRFRVPLLMAGLPLEHYLVYGGLVVWKDLAAAVGVAVLVVAFAWACARWAGRLERFWISTLLVLLVVALFALARAAGAGAAQADFLAQRDSDYAAYPRVRLIRMQEAAAGVGGHLADVPWTDCGRLLLAGGGRLFLVRPIRGAPGADLDAFVVPADQVEAVRITGAYRSCP